MTRYHWLLAVALVALAACEKSSVEPVSPETVPEDPTPWLLKERTDRKVTGLTGHYTALADFGQTRTSIEMNDAGTHAATVWSAGDSFEMYAYVASSDDLYYSVFTTAEGGESANFSYNYGLPEGVPYHAVYPEIYKYTYYEETLLLGLPVPAVQTAVPGGFEDGLAIAYASATDLESTLHFQSLVSLVRFRMSGSLVSQVKTVTIKGTSPLAGDAIIVPDGEGSAELTQSISFEGDEHSRTVTLSGNFVAGQDYYFVVVPGSQSGFQMIFADDAGHSTTKVAPAYTFPRSKICDFGVMDLGDAFTDDVVDYSPIQYMTATAGAPKPVTIAVIPDGFTASEMASYEMLAKSGIDALMNTEPFKSYKEYFNVWILRVPSNESGANITDGNGNIVTARDCYFGSKWGDGVYSDMVADGSEVYRFVKQNCPDIVNGKHTIEEVPVLMIINDSRYGGICHYSSNGQGYCMAPFSRNGGGLYWAYPDVEAPSMTATPPTVREVTEEEREEMGYNIGNWLNTLVHEYGGHCFSRLTDEYWYEDSKAAVSSISSHQWTVPYGLNISATYSNPVWKSALLGDDLQVKPSLLSKDARYGRIGVYQGGQVSVFNRWRSERISCMIDNRFYFSTWQRMLIVKRIMTLSGSAFDETSFWQKDVPTDPVRESGSSSILGDPRFVEPVPMLPPPVLDDDYML